MVHVIFDGGSLSLADYYQSGNGAAYFEGLPLYQRGHGYFAGMPLRQRGHGLGDILRTFWRLLKPMAVSAGKAVGQEGLATTARVLNDVVGGQNLKDSLASEGREGVRHLLDRASKSSHLQRGSGKRYKKRRTIKGQVILKPSEVVGKLVPASKLNKRRRIDILGHY